MLQFGEAHYIGDIGGDQPPESKLYTLGSKSNLERRGLPTDFHDTLVPHTDILPLIKYYATAWKTGVWPKITQDQVFVMARPHPALAVASGDSIGAPTGRDRVSHTIFAQ
jgi:glucan endo-1,3-alpha-glucosidase